MMEIRDTPGSTEEVDDHSDAASAGPQQRASAPQPVQLKLFGESSLTFYNQGFRAFRSLDLEKAVKLLHKHRRLMPRGYDVSPAIAAADFLLEGIRGAPGEACERPAYLCRLWDSFEDFIESRGLGRNIPAAEVKRAYFERLILEIDQCGLPDPSPLLGNFPFGFILMQAGRYEEAIGSLQNRIPQSPHNAALYGYLGDAYHLRRQPRVGRQCYREACLIDPASIDWRHLQDKDLQDLKRDLLIEYHPDPALALAWLPSHGRINGLFERKPLRLNDGLKEMVEDYLTIARSHAKNQSALLAAALFFRGIILCENEPSLKLIKKINLIQVRKMMKQVNPQLFGEFLKRIIDER